MLVSEDPLLTETLVSVLDTEYVTSTIFSRQSSSLFISHATSQQYSNDSVTTDVLTVSVVMEEDDEDHTLETVVTLVLGLLGMWGNGFTLVVLAKSEHMRQKITGE